ncbi:MAG: Gldg family protein [Pseudomonadota bacterium]
MTARSQLSHYALVSACIVLILVLAQRLTIQRDLTANARHTLLPQSVDTIAQLPDDIDIEIFINPLDAQLPVIKALLERYRSHKQNLVITVTDPAMDPARMRELNIAPGGELFIRYNHRLQRLSQISEATLTMALQRLAHATPPVARFVSGHGERTIKQSTNADISVLASQLADSGFTLEETNLSDGTPDYDNGVLVIASPLSRFLPIEVAVLLDYLSKGGNLLWLTEPESDDGLKAIELELGITRSPGVVVDLATENLDIERPDFAIANNYSPHPATQEFAAITLFPQAAALQLQANREWRAAALVQASQQSWTETGSLSGKVSFGDDNREISGPFPLVMALEREQNGKLQKVIVSGDGDFMADAWIANGGNRDLANRLFNWSVADNHVAAIKRPTALDNRLELSKSATFVLVAIALLLLPAVLFATAGRVWYSRRYG